MPSIADLNSKHQIPNTVQIQIATNKALTFRILDFGILVYVDTHGHSPWHFTVQASLDLNPGDLATSHIQ